MIIDFKIPVSNFEIVRDAICYILTEELANQKLLGNIDFDYDLYRERTTPLDNDELAAINVSYNSSDFGNKNQVDMEGKTTYFIDVYTTGQAEEGGNTGSEDSALRMQKLAAMIRYILSCTDYKTLDLEAGFIGGSMIESITTMDSILNQDSSFFKFCRISFMVRILETQMMSQPVLLSEAYTNVKIEETDKGYIFIKN